MRVTGLSAGAERTWRDGKSVGLPELTLRLRLTPRLRLGLCVSRGYETWRTGSPRASGMGVTPRPGSVEADMRPLTRCGAPSAVLTVT